ncbi:MAG TPA: hypothetical protein VEK08_25340 [Planctomycetota bacterium]|nr:hypothetical protein [Planctomycetota bacterium]
MRRIQYSLRTLLICVFVVALLNYPIWWTVAPGWEITLVEPDGRKVRDVHVDRVRFSQFDGQYRYHSNVSGVVQVPAIEMKLNLLQRLSLAVAQQFSNEPDLNISGWDCSPVTARSNDKNLKWVEGTLQMQAVAMPQTLWSGCE